jgi:hypothetical protein
MSVWALSTCGPSKLLFTIMADIHYRKKANLVRLSKFVQADKLTSK